MNDRLVRIVCEGLVAMLLPLALGGCLTGNTWILARGEDLSYYDNKTRKMVPDIRKPEPAAYALLPFAVVGDVALLPVWIGITIATNLGLMRPEI
jgi:hypothetical protein